ncbi:hypothetical protein FRB96_003260 [Tulasnella sp. 330]|nr:hypothetical protein FRB96_003260 [Tulasnella sp. 330]
MGFTDSGDGQQSYVNGGAHEIQNNVVQTRLIVIKQSHQDERRPHEDAFYQITNGFRSGRVARLMCSQELSHTREYHNREALGVLGYYVLRSSKSKAQSAGRRASTPERENDLELSGDELEDEEGGKEGEGDISMEPIAQESEARISTSDAGGNDSWRLDKDTTQPAFERVLVRLVFEAHGFHLRSTKKTKHLLVAAQECLMAIHELHEAGILHRDISYGNLLIRRDPVTKELRAVLIDLGLAVRCDEQGEPPGDSDNHHHLTLLDDSMAQPLYGRRHDIESLFWVLLWICLQDSQADEENKWARRTLVSLRKPGCGDVFHTKATVLARPESINMSGRYKEATPFLRECAQLCAANDLDYSRVNNLLNKYQPLITGHAPEPPKTPLRNQRNKRPYNSSPLMKGAYSFTLCTAQSDEPTSIT